MPVNVIKRDGSEQRFAQNKIKNAVAKAAKRAGAPRELINYVQKELPKEIQKELKGKKEVDSSEIRGLVLESLKQTAGQLEEIEREFRGHQK